MRKRHSHEHYHKAKGRSHGFDASTIAKLAVDLEAHTGEEMEIGGPYGLRSEVITFSNSHILIVTPDIACGNLNWICQKAIA